MSVPYYQWPEPAQIVKIHSGNGYIWEGKEFKGIAPKHQSRAEFFMIHKLLEADEVHAILQQAVQSLQHSVDTGGSKSPDSVDSFPTLWQFFIEHGQYKGELDNLLRPIINHRIEPYARWRYGHDVLVCHCFLRRYLPNERRRLGAHFDHHAFVTAVVGLNPEDFEGGLFLQGEARTQRSFIQLGKGDVVFHQYNLHHGVEVMKGSRYSLVFWLMDSRESCIKGTVPWYQRDAEAGDSDAQHLWASCLASGEHSGRSSPDLEAAIPWFEKAVAQKNVEAMNVYAAVLWADSFARDDQRALALWREASDLGYAKARGNLGGILCTGMDGRAPHDYTEGIRLLRSAAHMGDYDAMMKLGSHLRRAGQSEAVMWFEQCANMGNPDACAIMAEIYMTGELGATQDPDAVLKYTRWASNLDCIKASTNLGLFHARGDWGLPKDVSKALPLWQQAAGKGDPDAQINLALCHLHGEGGLQRDPMRGLALCKHAAVQGQLLALRLELEFSCAAEAFQANGGEHVGNRTPTQLIKDTCPHEEKSIPAVWQRVD